MSDRIKVGVKVRPLIAREKADKCQIHWQASSDTCITQIDPSTSRPKGDQHVFDHVFGPESSNREVFEVLVKPIVEAAVKGFNGTIFAYGQTASGKTYTMMGDRYEPGIIPQAVDLIFNAIDSSHGRQFLLRVCYMEIYNEKVNDLLLKSNQNLKIIEDPQGNVMVKGLTETITKSSQMVMDLMKKGETIRKIGETNMNERSSRSHSIFRMIIESRSVGDDNDEAIQVSHLNLVDLAGSERAGATGSVGDQFKEGCAINRSLFTLGKVISELSDGNVAFVNFRDSKLTRILQSSLGGNALTSIVCAITPAALEETSSTLGFASRARNIKNTATVNEVLSEAALLKRYIRQMAKLKSDLNSVEEQKSAENQHLQIQNLRLQERISRLEDALLVSSADDHDGSKSHERLKKLRRRTWSAPNRNLSRLSFAPPSTRSESVSSLNGSREGSSNVGNLSLKSGDDNPNDFDLFTTPLEEFEEALIKAERGKSLDVEDWLPQMGTNDDDTFLENNQPINYVQTRKPYKAHLSKVEEVNFPETPPRKLRAKIRDVEKELDEISEYTRLEKQMFDAELCAELERVKNELQESRAQCEALQGVQEELNKLKCSDRSLYDAQILLMDSSKQVSRLTDENRDIKDQLSIAREQCQELEKVKSERDSVEQKLAESQKEIISMKERLRSQQALIEQLQKVQEDFDMQMELTVSKYDQRQKDLVQALEDARLELSNFHQPPPNPKTKYFGQLYSLEEEPSIDDLVQQVKYLSEENKELNHQINEFSRRKVTENDELLNLKAIIEEKTKELEECNKRFEEIHEDVGDIKRASLNLLKLHQSTEPGEEREMFLSHLNDQGNLLAERERTIDALRDEIDGFKKAEVHWKNKLADLESEMLAVRKLLSHVADDTVNSQEVSVTNLISTFLSSYTEMERQCKKQHEEIESDVKHSQSDDVLESHYQFDSLKEENCRLLNQLNDHNNLIAEKEQELESLRDQIKLLKKAESQYNVQLENLESEIFSVRKLLTCIDGDKEISLASLISTFLSSYTEIKLQCEKLRDESKSHLKQEQPEDILAFRSKFESIKEENCNLLTQLKSLENILAGNKIEKEEKERELDSLRDEIEGLKEADIQCNQKLEKLESELLSVRSMLSCGEDEEINAQEVPLASLVSNFLSTYADMQRQCQRLTEQKESHVKQDQSNEISASQSNYKLIKEENCNLLNRLKNLESIVAEKEKEKEESERELETLRDHINGLIRSETMCNAKISDLEFEILSVRKLLSCASDKEDSPEVLLSDIISSFLSSFADTKSQCEKLAGEIDLLMKQGQSDEVSEYQCKLELMKDENGNLLAQVKDQGDMLAEKEKEKEEMLRELDTLRDQIKELTKSEAQHSKKLVELETEILSIRKLLSSIEGDVGSTQEVPVSILISNFVSSYWETKRDCERLSKENGSHVKQSQSYETSESQCDFDSTKEETCNFLDKFKEQTDENELNVKQIQSDEASEIQCKLESIREENCILLDQIQAQNDLLEEKERELNSLKHQIEGLSQVEVRSNARVEELESQILSVGKLLTSVPLQEGATEEAPLASIVSSLLSSYVDSKKECEKLCAENQRCRDDFEREISSLKQCHSEEISQHQCKMELMKEENFALLEKTGLQNNLLAEKDSELESLRGESEHLTLAEAQCNARIKELELEILSARKVLSSASEEKAITDEVPLATMISTLISSYADSKKECEKLSAEIQLCKDNFEFEISSLKQCHKEEISEYQCKVALSTEESADMLAQKKIQDNLLAEKESELQCFREKTNQLTEALAQCNARIKELELEILSARKVLSSASEEKAITDEVPLATMISTLTSSYVDSKKECEKLSAEIQLCKDNFEFEISSLKQCHKEEISEYQCKVALSTEESADMLAQKKIQDNLLAEKESELQCFREKTNQLTEALAQCNARLKELESEILSARKVLCSASEEKAITDEVPLATMISTLISSYADSKKECEKLSAEIQLCKDNFEFEISSLKQCHKEEISEYQCKVALSTEESADMLAQKKIQDNLLAEKESELKCFREKTNQQTEALAQCNARLKELELEILSVRKVLCSDSEEKAITDEVPLATMISTLTSSYADSKKECEKLSVEIQLCKDKFESETSSLKQSHKEEISEHQCKVGLLKEENVDLLAKIKCQDSLLVEKERELITLRDRIERLQGAEVQCHDEISKLKAELQSMKVMSSSASSCSTCAKIKKELGDQLYETQNELLSLRETNNHLSAELKSRLKSVHEAHSEVKHLKKIVATFERGEAELLIKTRDVHELTEKLNEKERQLKEKINEIEQLEKDKKELDKECDYMLSWGRDSEELSKQLSARLTDALTKYGETQISLVTSVLNKILFLVNTSKQVYSLCEKVIAEQIEMQLSSKEKAVRNAQARVDKLAQRFREAISRKLTDFDSLQKICEDLGCENNSVSNLDVESSTLWLKIQDELKQTNVKECKCCKATHDWGKKQEELAIEYSNQAARLEEEVKKLQSSTYNRSLRKYTELTSENIALRDKISSLEKSLAAHKPTVPCECSLLRETIRKQQIDIADRNAKITHLKMLQEARNKPAEDMIGRLEEKLKKLKDENSVLNADRRRILESRQNTTVFENNVKKLNAETQTSENDDEIYKSRYWAGGPSGIVEGANRQILEAKLRKVEQERKTYRELCTKRKDKIVSLENQLKQFMKGNAENENPSQGSTYFTRSRKP